MSQSQVATRTTPAGSGGGSGGSSGSSGQVTASWQELAKLPQLLSEAKSGILALRALVSTPSAAMASGSPPAGAAIVALGAEILMFLAQTVQAIDDDIDGMTGVAANYQRNEQNLVAESGAGTQALSGLTPAIAPHTGSMNAGLQSCTARGALTGISTLDDIAVPLSGAVHVAGDASRAVLDSTADGMTTLGRAAGSVADRFTYIPGIGVVPRFGSGPSLAGGAVRGATGLSSSALHGASDAVRGVEDSASVAEATARRFATRADDLLTLDGSCATGGTHVGQGARP